MSDVKIQSDSQPTSASTPTATSMASTYAPRTDVARRFLHFLENGLQGEFYRKVFLLEKEFSKPPKRFDYIYQRYYLSRSQELLVFNDQHGVRHRTSLTLVDRGRRAPPDFGGSRA